jgi:hypothetical protein
MQRTLMLKKRNGKVLSVKKLEKYSQRKYSIRETAKTIPQTFPQKMGTSLWITAPQPRQVLEIKKFSHTARKA